MKKLYTLLLFTLCTQLASAINEVPNPGFENWAGGNPVSWNTPNTPGSGIPITMSSLHHGGGYSLKGQAVITPDGDTIPPVLYADVSGMKFHVSQRYSTFEFWYQANLSGGDLLTPIVIIMDSTSNNIGMGFINITVNTGTWTHYSLPISYTGAGPAAYGRISLGMFPPIGGDRGYPLLASYFYLDDVSLTGVVGIDEVTGAGKLNVYPIPAHDAFTVEAASTQGKNATLVLTDASGRVVMSKMLSTITGTLLKEEMNVEGIRPGLYSLMILNDDKTSMRKLVIE